MRLLPCGDRATLLEFDDLTTAAAWHAALTPHAEVALGACTVLVHQPTDEVRRLLGSVTPQPVSASTSRVVEVPVRYDGPDLDAVAEHTGLTTAEVIAAHTGTPWTAGFAGFAPGFVYLVGGDQRLNVPRLERPRPQIAPGSVGLAGEFSGIYPRASPGGWQLLGTTELTLWDISQPEPATIQPGMIVQFVETRSSAVRS